MEFSDADDIAQTEDPESGNELRSVHHAAASGNLELLTQGVQRDASALEQRNREGLTPIAIAVQSQQYSAMKWLVKLGADVNAQDGDGRTCLSIAAYQGWTEGVLYLLKHGSRHSICDRHGRTPLSASTHSRDISTMTTLLMNINEEEINMADNEQTQAMFQPMDFRVGPGGPLAETLLDHCRMTALQWAAFHERPTHIQLLLSRGADVRTQDIDGKTALHWAAQNGCLLSCKLLLEYSQDIVNITDNTGKTPAHLAAAAGKSDIIQDLCRYENFDVDALDRDDRSPLHWAAALGQAECVKVLLSINAGWDLMDIDGSTPLQYAQQLGHSNCQKYLEAIWNIKTSPGLCNVDEASAERKNALSNAFSYIKNMFKQKSECATESTLKPAGCSYAKTELNNNSGQLVPISDSNQMLPQNRGAFVQHDCKKIIGTGALSVAGSSFSYNRPPDQCGADSGLKNVSLIQTELTKIDDRIRLDKENDSSPSKNSCDKDPMKFKISNRLANTELPPLPSPKPGDLGPIRGPIPTQVHIRQSKEYTTPSRKLDADSLEMPYTPPPTRIRSGRVESLLSSSRQGCLSPHPTPERSCRSAQKTLTPLRRCLRDDQELLKKKSAVTESVGLNDRYKESAISRHSGNRFMDERIVSNSPTPPQCSVKRKTIDRKLLDRQINSLLT